MTKCLRQAFAGSMIAAALAGMTGCATVRARAGATLQPTTDFGTQATVKFEQHDHTLLIDATVTGLRPAATHGFAIHEKGDCSMDALNAGGHFNPLSAPHGSQTGAHHVGDLPNLVADASGTAHARFEVALPRIDGGTVDVRGLALIVHDRADDFTTQPTGNTGARRACGIIVLASQ